MFKVFAEWAAAPLRTVQTKDSKNLGEDKAAECPGAKAEAPSSPTRRRVKKAD